MISVRFFQESAVCIFGYLDLENNWNGEVIGEEVPFLSRAVFLVEPLVQCLLTFLRLIPFNRVLHACGGDSPTVKLFSLLFYNYNFATAMNDNLSVPYAGHLTCNPCGGSDSWVRTTGLDTSKARMLILKTVINTNDNRKASCRKCVVNHL